MGLGTASAPAGCEAGRPTSVLGEPLQLSGLKSGMYTALQYFVYLSIWDIAFPSGSRTRSSSWTMNLDVVCVPAVACSIYMEQGSAEEGQAAILKFQGFVLPEPGTADHLIITFYLDYYHSSIRTY